MRQRTLNPYSYPGGLAVWYAMQTPLSNSPEPYEANGIHIHARVNRPKVIDESYDTVHFPVPRQFYKHQLVTNGIFSLTSEMMFHFRIAEALGNTLTTEVCPHCNHVHLDKGLFAAKPHKTHLCESCGRTFEAQTRGVSNPAVLLRSQFFANLHNPAPFRIPDRTIEVDSAEYDWYELWGTCTGALWTMSRPEDNGLHLHCYRKGKRVVDETFGKIVVDGITIDNTMAQMIMPQQQVPEIAEWLGVTYCPQCNTPAFHQSITPKDHSQCNHCGHTWHHPTMISNPILELSGYKAHE